LPWHQAGNRGSTPQGALKKIKKTRRIKTDDDCPTKGKNLLARLLHVESMMSSRENVFLRTVLTLSLKFKNRKLDSIGLETSLNQLAIDFSV